MTPIERALDRWDDEGGHAPPGPHTHAEPEVSEAEMSCSCVALGLPCSCIAVAAVRGTRSVADEKAFAEALAALAELADDALGGVEGLDRASCSPNITYLAQIGMGAAARGCSQEGWRAMVAITQGSDATRELDQAEECMRYSGLWPWA